MSAPLGQSGRSVGTATLIGQRLVLTAAHNVFDSQEPGSVLPEIRVGSAHDSDGVWLASQVVWPSSYVQRQGASVASLDLAILEITDPQWSPPARLLPVQWGRLTGRRPGVACEAIGYPAVLRDEDGTWEPIHVSGRINPGSGSRGGRYDLTALDTPPQVGPDVRPWAGMSGAGVYCADLLTAVVTVDHRGFGHGRLVSVPTYRLLADAAARAVLERHNVDLVTDSVELSATLVRPRNTLTGRRPDRISSGMLLRADAQMVGFYGRERELTELQSLCIDDPSQRIGVWVLTGPGGRGKTRLAGELVQRIHGREVPGVRLDHSWVAGFLRTRSTNAAPLPSTAVDALTSSAAPVLLVVDYAEARTAEVLSILKAVSEHPEGPPLRVLLLARAAGEWWETLAREADRDLAMILPAPIPLGPLDVTVADRQTAFRVATHAFMKQLVGLPIAPAGGDWAQRAENPAPPASLSRDEYASPLSLHMIALLTLLETGDAVSPFGHQDSPTGMLPERYLLQHHETRYWQSTAPPGFGVSDLTRIMAVTTTCGAAGSDEAVRTLRALPLLADAPTPTVVQLSNWVRDAYVPAPSEEWGAVEPDRIGEHLAIGVFASDIEILRRVLDTCSPGQLRRAITILGRALGNSSIPTPQRHIVAKVLSTVYYEETDGGSFGPTLLVIGPSLDDPAILLTALMEKVANLSQGEAARSHDRVPYVRGVFAPLGAALAKRVVSDWEGQIGKRRDAEWQLASHLRKASDRLALVGDSQAGLESAHRAVEIWRELIRQYPNDYDAYVDDLALALVAVSERSQELGRLTVSMGALAESEQHFSKSGFQAPYNIAVSQHRRANLLLEQYENGAALTLLESALGSLRKSEKDAGNPYFSLAEALLLGGMSLAQVRLGRASKGLSAANEAVDRLRALVPNYQDKLALQLFNRAQVLVECGRYSDAIDDAAESADMFRQLYHDHRTSDPQDLIDSLDFYRALCEAHGRPGEAATARAEADALALPDTRRGTHKIRLSGLDEFAAQLDDSFEASFSAAWGRPKKRRSFWQRLSGGGKKK